MNLTEAMELLKDGQMLCTAGDLGRYTGSDGNEYATDNRSAIKDGLHVVKPIGIDCLGYVYYVCYDCGEVHSIHKSKVGEGKLIMPGCCACRSHTHRLHINYAGKIAKVKRDKFYFDVEI
jgi:hypothetical protein